jgi:Endonuclease/Exonuclease/phosphatase family
MPGSLRIVPTVVLLFSVFSTSTSAQSLAPDVAEGCIRIATYNASLNRASQGKLAEDLKSRDKQIIAIATVVRAVRPDILLVNELDYDSNVDHAHLLNENFFTVKELDQLGNPSWPLPNHFSASVNTGIPSEMDLNSDGKIEGAEDAFGYGKFPGQYGMAVFSRFGIDKDHVRSLQRFLWSRLPGALRPKDPKAERPFYDDSKWPKLRLSSKSFWDVPISTPQGKFHILASHPTPPAFDGPEDRNGCRNHDEIKLIQMYIESSAALQDDRGEPVRFSAQWPFAILGDLNCDPLDGDSRADAINALLLHRQVAQSPAPRSLGAVEAAKQQGKANQRHRSDPAEDTADFNDTAVGNLRVDYVMASRHCSVRASGVVWPDLNEFAPEKRQIVKSLMDASDHHMVWMDIKLQQP